MTLISSPGRPSLPVSFSFTLESTCSARAFCTSLASTSLPGGATDERWRRGCCKEDIVSPAEELVSPMMDWRRSDGNEGSMGEAVWWRRQVRRGSCMNCVCVSR
jgi:hypothetical protein